MYAFFFFFSSRRRHTRCLSDWSSDVCSSDLDAVKREKAELGIAFDGDGDRIGAVDEKGTPVLGDQLLVLFGRDLVKRMGPGKPVIFDVKCSEVLPQMLKRAGLEPVMWKTGHSFIKMKMNELGAPLAVE